MNIDLTELSYDELLELNDQIIERLKLLEKMNAYQSMHRFNLGSRVCFESGRHGTQVGTLVKFNQKTVGVLTDDGRRWKVPPQMLSPVIEKSDTNENPKVVMINRKPGEK